MQFLWIKHIYTALFGNSQIRFDLVFHQRCEKSRWGFVTSLIFCFLLLNYYASLCWLVPNRTFSNWFNRVNSPVIWLFPNNLINKLKYFGRYATAGAVSGPIASIDIRTIYLHDLSLFGCTTLGNKVFKNIIDYIENNEINSLVDKVFPLKNLIEAQKHFLKKDFIGKIIITAC